MLIIPSCFHVSYDFINSWTGGSLCEVCEHAVLEVLPVERWSWMQHRRIVPHFAWGNQKKRVVVGMWGIPVFDWSLCGKHLESFCRWHYKAQHLVKNRNQTGEAVTTSPVWVGKSRPFGRMIIHSHICMHVLLVHHKMHSVSNFPTNQLIASYCDH